MTTEAFNFLEGAFWIAIGFGALLVCTSLPMKCRNLALYSSVIFIAFGISDLAQARFGSFFLPGMEWLLLWKVINLLAMAIAFLTYLRIRLT